MYSDRKKHIHWKSVVGFLCLLFTLSFPTAGWAQEGTLNFHVKPEFPTSQVDNSTSYFDLNLGPGETEKLTLVLQNDQDEAIQVKITPHTAYTNVTGVVEYGKDAESPDPTVLHSLDNLIEQIDPIELAGKESKIVELTLTMPEESFEGILAGGLRIEEVLEEEEQEDEGEGVAIKNEFSYVIGVVVSTNRSTVQPELDLLEVFADQLNYRNVISATIQNFTPTFVNRMEVDAEVRAEGKDDVLYRTSQEQLQMAPNSHFDFPISLEGDRFVSGDYVLTMTARSGEHEWSWTENFTIDSDEARKLNRADVTIDSSTNWWLIVSLVLVILLVLAIGYLFYQKKQREKEYQKQYLKKKRQAKAGQKKEQERLNRKKSEKKIIKEDKIDE